MGVQDDYRPTDGVEGAVARLLDDACLGYDADGLDAAAAHVAHALTRLEDEDRHALLDAIDAVDRGAYEAVEDAAMDNRHRVERAEATNRELEAALRGVLAAIEDIDQAAWTLTMAVGNGDTGWLDTAVEDVQKRHDLAYVGPSSPVSRARAALEGGT